MLAAYFFYSLVFSYNYKVYAIFISHIKIPFGLHAKTAVDAVYTNVSVKIILDEFFLFLSLPFFLRVF